HLLAAPVAAKRLVLLGVRSLSRAQPSLNLGLELRRTLFHALVAHHLVLGGVRLDLRPVERDMAELRQPRLFAQPQNLREQAGERLQVTLAEETVRKSGGSSPTMLMKSTRSRAALAIRRDE